MFTPIGKPTYYCHHCRKQVEIDVKPGRRDECVHCGLELHVCLNCELYDPRMTRGCREPQADEVRDRERANFCDWFSFRPGQPAGDGPSDADKGRSAFEALFRK